MKKIENCIVENCIPTPASCVDWDGGDIEFLGICNGDKLTNLMWEIVTKLKEFAGEDLSSFDIDSLLDICSQKAPTEITITSILTLLKNNDVCLKDYIDTLNDKLNELFQDTSIDVNLKCYADFDNLGNSLSITREQLDQLIIDNLCNHKGRIESLEGAVINIQSQIDNLETSTTVDELSFATCINASILPTSTQVINTSEELCDLETAVGDPADVADALALTPGDLNTEFGLISGWDLTPANLSANYGNLLLEVENLRQRIKFMEDNCCAITCDDIKLGITALFNEDNTGIVIKFTSGSGTSIPLGFTDGGSTGVVTDIDGNTETFTLDIVDNFTNNNETDVDVSSLNLAGDLTLSITAILTNGSITCEKCVGKNIKQATCAFCEVSAEGEDGSYAVIIYEGPVIVATT